MKFSGWIFRRTVAVVGSGILLLVAIPASCKEKESSAKTVDSGAFGVYNAKHRVATETFSVRQNSDGSIISSEFKSEQGELKADQSSELQLTPSGEIRQYTWKELAPEKLDATVEPNDTFLIEHFGTGPSDRHDQNFLLPASTTILDDYFFIQREVLAWKYLATTCPHGKGVPRCPVNQKTQFGALNPHARSSMGVTIEFTGRDKVNVRGTERDLIRFVLRTEAGDWTFWLDDQLKLVRLLAEGEGTEVIRD
ncbi:MAG TPA: hypothetical protein VIL63_08500 [Terriglobales bacterium]